MLDAIYMGVSKMKDARNSKKKPCSLFLTAAITIVAIPKNEIKSMVKEADVQIYSIGILARPRLQQKNCPVQP